MEQNLLNREQMIEESKLNQSYYFQSLLQEAMNLQLLTEAQIKRIQLELIDLMGKEVARYTNEESSSVPVEKAQELLQSITYNIGFYLKTINNNTEKLKLLQNEKINVLFYKGMEEITKRISKASELLHQIQKDTLRLNNIAYQDTIHTDLPKFFHDYNVEYGAHRLDTSADYPILYPITEYLGLEYMEEFLKSLAVEGEFIGRFQADRINQLLYDFDKEAEHMLINIYELVLMNALGCRLNDKNIYELEFNNTEIMWLQNKLQGQTEEELLLKLDAAYTQLGEELALSEEELRYGRSCLTQAAVRLCHCLKMNTLSKFFICSHEQGIIEIDAFEQGTMMENEVLRKLIIRIGGASDVVEKVSIIKDEVHSIDDLTEILDSCFEDKEYNEVLSLLGDRELAVLKKYVLSDQGGIDLKDYETEKQWQRVLLEL